MLICALVPPQLLDLNYWQHVFVCRFQTILRVNCCSDISFGLQMDSEVRRDGRLMDLVDQQWREDTLPKEDVAVPDNELPELEPDNGHSNETPKEQEEKWTDLALNQLHEHPPQNVGSG